MEALRVFDSALRRPMLFYGGKKNPARCPRCSGSGFLLGSLGCLRWFRCRDCGTVYHSQIRSKCPRNRRNSEKKGVDHG